MSAQGWVLFAHKATLGALSDAQELPSSELANCLVKVVIKDLCFGQAVRGTFVLD